MEQWKCLVTLEGSLNICVRVALFQIPQMSVGPQKPLVETTNQDVSDIHVLSEPYFLIFW